ncbi:MAG: hypothetical protein ACRDKT_00140 [Actinomycetota bacterium]
MSELAHEVMPSDAEVAHIRERLVIAPCGGHFEPLPPETFTSEGEWARRGQRIANIRSHDVVTPVVCHFDGWVMGMLAIPGQPVHKGDRLFWIRT